MSTDRGGSRSVSPLRVASSSTVAGVESGRALAFPSIDPGCVDRFVSGFGGTRTGDLLLSVHGSANLHLENNKEISMTPATNKGIVDRPSNHSVDQTVEKLRGIFGAKGVTLFASVDHSGEAEKAGMKMPPTKLLIFGSPKAGTPLMLAAPSIAIDLPLKILVWQDAQGKVWVSYNSLDYLKERHGLPQDLLQNIAVVETLAAKAAE